MAVLLILLMLCLLLRAPLTMDAASAACRLFVTAVLPGLFPYMTAALMLASRFGGRLPPGGLLLLAWGGGSPTGARLLPMLRGGDEWQRVRLAVASATMSPMFLLGTIGGWLGGGMAGAAVLAGVIAGGVMAGGLAGLRPRRAATTSTPAETPLAAPLSFGAAVEQAARTMLLVCGTMVMLRVLSALAADALPGAWTLPVTTLLEVTTGVQAIAAMPWPLALRTALCAGAAGFGGMAVIMQNRALYPRGWLSLPEQLAWQAVHGVTSFLLTLGMMLMAGAA